MAYPFETSDTRRSLMNVVSRPRTPTRWVRSSTARSCALNTVEAPSRLTRSAAVASTLRSSP